MGVVGTVNVELSLHGGRLDKSSEIGRGEVEVFEVQLSMYRLNLELS